MVRRQQVRSFESFTAFQQRILCHRLPKSFDDMPHDGNLQQKHRQESKRRLLFVEFEKYETALLDHAHAYELEWNRQDVSESILKCIEEYLAQYTNRQIRAIRFHESRFHTSLTHRRSSSTSARLPIDVYPRVIVDVDHVLLNRVQLDYLSYHGQR